MYVDGFLVPAKKDELDEYKRQARFMAEIFKEHGATRVVECLADDVKVGEITSFPRALLLEEGEIAFFSWIEYPDKATRDACIAKTFSDPRVKEPEDGPPFDGKRIIFGGFETILDL